MSARRFLRRAIMPAVVTAGAAALLGLGAAAVVVLDDDPAAVPAGDYSFYDHPDVYWVFQHRDQLCSDAQVLLDENDATLRDVIDANVVTFAEADLVTTDAGQQYLRGLLTGCVRY